MVSPKPKTKLTYEDYAKTPEDERWELIDGELVMAAAPGEPHQSAQAALGSRVFLFVEQRGLGRVYFSPFDVVLSDTDTVQPDLLFVSNERLDIITPANIQGAPDLVVEIRSLSTARQDWTVKRDLYARHGVREYWLVDPDAEILTVLLLGELGFEEAGTYWKGQTLKSPTLEGLLVNLDDIFRS